MDRYLKISATKNTPDTKPTRGKVGRICNPNETVDGVIARVEQRLEEVGVPPVVVKRAGGFNL